MSTGKFEDLTGMKFGYYTVIERAPGRPKGNGKLRTMWKCKCVCGTIKEVSASHLKSRPNISCGCQKASVMSSIKCEDLTWQRFGRLTVIRRVEDYERPSGHKDVQWLCKCDCGNETVKRSIYLKKSNCQSCGCWKSEITSDIKANDLTGQRFGMLTVLSFAFTKRTSGGNPVRMYNCICDCGNKKLVSSNSLTTGSTASCGCKKFSHGEDRVYQVLKAFGVPFTTEYTFKDLRGKRNPLRFDFAVFNDDGSIAYLIEYQGVQHFKKTWSGDEDVFGKQQREVTDDAKREYCLAHGITLYEISYKDDIEASVIKIIATHANPVPSVV